MKEFAKVKKMGNRNRSERNKWKGSKTCKINCKIEGRENEEKDVDEILERQSAALPQGTTTRQKLLPLWRNQEQLYQFLIEAWTEWRKARNLPRALLASISHRGF